MVTCPEVTLLISHGSRDRRPDLSDSHLNAVFNFTASVLENNVLPTPGSGALGSVLNPAERCSPHPHVFLVISRRRFCSEGVDPPGGLHVSGERWMPRP